MASQEALACSRESDLLNSLRFVRFVSTLSGKDKQCLCSGKGEL